MAYPFFSEKAGGSNASLINGKIDEIEWYHIIMLAYPAYTVEGIKTELSWRQIEKLMEYWKDKEPSNIRLKRIEEILKKAHGVKFVNKEQSDDELMAEIRGMGWL